MTESVTLEPPPVTARRAQTREKLMSAAVDVFADRGIIGASVEEIAEAAGFTRGAFYSNFADKDDLVLALLRREIDAQYAAAQHAIRAMKAAAAPEHSAEDLVSIALTAYGEVGRAGREWVLTQQELLLYAARTPAVRDPYLIFSAECIKQFSALIGDAVSYAGREFTVSFEDAIGLLTATHNQIQLQSLLLGDEPDARHLRVLLLAITRPAAPLP